MNPVVLSTLSSRLLAAPGLSGTRETVPSHIWMHETELAASRELRADESISTERIHAKLRAAYHAGEPMWMAAYAAVQMAQGDRKAARESLDGLDAVRSGMRRAV